MTNKIREGKSIEYSNSGSAISAGDVVVLESSIGVALTDIDATTGKGTVEIEGVFELAAVNDDAFGQGEDLFWDSSAGKLTQVGAGNTYAGIAAKAKAES